MALVKKQRKMIKENEWTTNLQKPIRNPTPTTRTPLCLGPLESRPSNSLPHEDIDILRNNGIRILRNLRLLAPEIMVQEPR